MTLEEKFQAMITGASDTLAKLMSENWAKAKSWPGESKIAEIMNVYFTTDGKEAPKWLKVDREVVNVAKRMAAIAKSRLTPPEGNIQIPIKLGPITKLELDKQSPIKASISIQNTPENIALISKLNAHGAVTLIGHEKEIEDDDIERYSKDAEAEAEATEDADEGASGKADKKSDPPAKKAKPTTQTVDPDPETKELAADVAKTFVGSKAFAGRVPKDSRGLAFQSVLALDLASKVGIAHRIFDHVWTLQHKITATDHGGRMAELGDMLEAIDNEIEAVEAIVIENVQHANAQGKGTNELYAALRAKVCEWAKGKCVTVYGVNPMSLKKFHTGSGKATKSQMVDAAVALGFNVATDDEADAVALLNFLDMKRDKGKTPALADWKAEDIDKLKGFKILQEAERPEEPLV